MSKTFKTRPLRVRMVDEKDLAVGLEEIHYHDKGFCDLPEKTFKEINAQHESPDFHWGKSCTYFFSYTGVNVCGCRICTGFDSRRSSKRRVRHAKRDSMRRILKVVNSRGREVEPLEELEAFAANLHDAAKKKW